MTQLSLEQVAEAYGKYTEQLAELQSSFDSAKSNLLTKLDAIKLWLWRHGEHTADSVVEEYVAMRDQRAELKHRYDSEDEKIKSEMNKREIWLLEALNTVGAENFRTNHGTAFKQTKVKSSCSDWPAYYQWIAETGRFDGMEKRVSQSMISDLIKEGKDLPPGINTYTEIVVTVRKS